MKVAGAWAAMLVLGATATAVPAAEPAPAPGAPPAHGARPHVDPPKTAEEFMMRLFTVACVAFARDPSRTVEFADGAKMPVIRKPYSAMFLEGLRGAVWSASNQWGRYVLAMREDGTCLVYARKADTAAVRTLLERGLLAGIGEQYTVVTDGPKKMRDGPTHQRWVTGTGQRDERLYVDFTAAQAGAPFAATVSVRLVNTGAARPAATPPKPAGR